MTAARRRRRRGMVRFSSGPSNIVELLTASTENLLTALDATERGSPTQNPAPERQQPQSLLNPKTT